MHELKDLPDPSSIVKPRGSHTVFHVSNLDVSTAFYTRKLGFRVEFRLGEPPTYVGLRLVNVCLHLSSTYLHKNNTGHGYLYIMIDNAIDDLYQQFLSNQVEFYSLLGDRDFGLRDFAIMDPDGNQIGFGTPISKR